jgi:hypothetical protein
METIEPPNYGPQPARFGPRCDMCAYFMKAERRCKKYAVSVMFYCSCDDWIRDPNLPIGVV